MIRARTDRHMIGDCTESVETACSWTRILTFIADTSSVHGTVCIAQTLWSADFIRIAVIFWQTFADSVIIFDAAVSVWSTWRRDTRVFPWRWCRRSSCQKHNYHQKKIQYLETFVCKPYLLVSFYVSWQCGTKLVNTYKGKYLTWLRRANSERISNITIYAHTVWNMVYYKTTSIEPARSWAGVSTLLIYTC